ncbi:MAG: type II secretion system F family protein [Candidatus Omnitrophica bacterium]|nr:type II secretion system F family protein [Candidatus Omnitrophota bacterium]
MPTFKYKAKKGISEVVEGVLVAENKDDAANKLFDQKLFPIEIEPQVSSSSAEVVIPKKKKAFNQVGLKSFLRRISKNKVSQKDVLLFTQNLATLIRAKVELLAGLKILHEQAEDGFFKEVITKIYNSIESGESFSEALEWFPKNFSPLFISIVKAGEVSGNMEVALSQLTDFMQMRDNLKRKVLGALIYPFILSCVGVMSVFVILNFVIPRLGGIFNELGTSLPIATEIVLKISEITTKSWAWLVIALAIFIWAIILSKGSKILVVFSQRVVAKLPILKRLVKNQEMVNFSKSFGLLIRSGVPVLQSLETATLSISDLKMHEELDEVAKRIKEGQKLSEAMIGFRSLPGFFIKMVSVGEESGRLEEVLDEVVSSYHQQIDSDIGIITSIIEPVLILVLGLILGAIVITILLPIFQVTQMIH